MDPTETLINLLQAVDQQDVCCFKGCLQDLAEWLRRDGFLPDLAHPRVRQLIGEVPAQKGTP